MRRTLILGLLLFIPTQGSTARQIIDTMVVRLDPIVVEAERYSKRLADATSAISTLDVRAFSDIPVSGATSLFSMTPGLGFLSLDGTGRDAQAVVRGFFGGGDAEYVQVLLDGVPLNDLETGLVPWDLIDLNNLARVEVLRGGSSSLYGDAAIGGVMNLYSLRPPGRSMSGRISYGSYSTLEAAGRFSDVIGPRSFFVAGAVDRSDGYREHGARESASVSAGVDLAPGAGVDGRLAISTSWRDVERPGPLTDSLLFFSRVAASPMFSFDRIDERRHSADLTLQSSKSGEANLNWLLRARGAIRDANDISTLALAADFGDTQDRELLTRSFGANLQVSTDAVVGRIVAGIDVSRNLLESTYYQFFTGSAADYTAAGALSRGDLAVAGEGARTLLGGFVQIESKRFGPASVTAGARADRILDRYTPEGDVDVNNTQDALSPKVGLNIEAIASADYRLNVYASAGKSFKAPAIDQLFDQRQTPVPFPPFAISISNGELKPQRGDNFEVGAYSQLLVPDRGRAEVSVAAYRMDMRDELDFSFDEFRLINIGESRHEGIEIGAKYFDRLGLSAFANYALQSTTFRNGDNAGNFVKAVPRDLIDAGVSFVHTSGLAVGIRYSGAHRIYLDDQNTRKIEPVDRVDVEVSASVAGTRIVLEVFNVLDASDFSTGFPDPGGSDARLVYPLAQRYFRLGFRYGRND